MTSDVEQTVDAYINIRNERDRLTQEYEKQDAALKHLLTQIEQQLLGTCNELRVDSLKTQAGTVIKKLNERFWAGDWHSFHEFVLENKVPELLEKRVAQGNMREFLAAHPEIVLPPGVNVAREYVITIRKPNGK
jgi:hypothetical protein